LNSGALKEITASNSFTKKGSWMRVYEGIFSPVCGVARGYQCPVFAEGKLASRVKDKFVKEWGPAAKLQVQRDKEISKETSENVQQMNDLFVAYNLFCTDDAEKKQQAKESYDETKGQMDAYENDLGAQPPGAKTGSIVASNLSFGTSANSRRATHRKKTSQVIVPVPPGGIYGTPGSTSGLLKGVMDEFKSLINTENDDHSSYGHHASKRRRLKERVAELERRKASLRDDVRFYNEMGEEASKMEGMEEIFKLNIELKKMQKDIDEEDNNDAAAPGNGNHSNDEVEVVDSSNNVVTPAHGSAHYS
jgi:hypothetical protein